MRLQGTPFRANLISERPNCFIVEFNGKRANWIRYSRNGDVLTSYDPKTGIFYLQGWVCKAVEKSLMKAAA